MRVCSRCILRFVYSLISSTQFFWTLRCTTRQSCGSYHTVCTQCIASQFTDSVLPDFPGYSMFLSSQEVSSVSSNLHHDSSLSCLAFCWLSRSELIDAYSRWRNTAIGQSFHNAKCFRAWRRLLLISVKSVTEFRSINRPKTKANVRCFCFELTKLETVFKTRRILATLVSKSRGSSMSIECKASETWRSNLC